MRRRFPSDCGFEFVLRPTQRDYWAARRRLRAKRLDVRHMQAAYFAGTVEAEHNVGGGLGETAVHDHVLEAIDDPFLCAGLARESAELGDNLLPKLVQSWCRCRDELVDHLWPARSRTTTRRLACADLPLDCPAHPYDLGRMPGAWLLDRPRR